MENFRNDDEFSYLIENQAEKKRASDGLQNNLNDVIYGSPRFQSVIAKTAIRQGI